MRDDTDPEQEKALKALLAVIRRREKLPWWNELVEQDGRRRAAEAAAYRAGRRGSTRGKAPGVYSEAGARLARGWAERERAAAG